MKKGLRLQDYINTKILDIDMPSDYVRPKPAKKFSYKDEAVPKELQGLDPQYDILETLTILAMHVEHRIRTGHWDKVFVYVAYRLALMMDVGKAVEEYQMLKAGTLPVEESVIFRALHERNFTVADLENWLKCLNARLLRDALTAMQGTRWPDFLLIFTLKRRCHSRADALALLKLYQQYLPGFKKSLQIGLFIRTHRHVQVWLIECVPMMCRLLVQYAHRDLLVDFTLNQLLWLVSGFGKIWSKDNGLILADAMKVLFRFMNLHDVLLDTKGYLAIAYVTYFVTPKKSKAIVEKVRKHDYPRSHEELVILSPNGGSVDPDGPTLGRISYTHGIYALELLHCDNFEQTIEFFRQVPTDRQNSVLWAFLLLKLRELGRLNDEILCRLWTTMFATNTKVTPFVVEQFVKNTRDVDLMQRFVVEAATEKRCTLKPTIMENILQQKALQDPENTLVIFQSMKSRSPRLYSAVMSALMTVRPDQVWQLYTTMRDVDRIEPTVEILTLLCKTALNLRLQFDGVYVAQRVVLEYKMWVRGALVDGSDVDDVLKVYPTNVLFEYYIRLIGTAGYTQELLEILPWMNRIQFEASKRCLCTLIRYAPNGQYLLKMGQKLGGQWPSESEFQDFCNQ